MKRILGLLLLFPILAGVDPHPWMKKENPSELAVVAYADEDCPITDRRLTEIAFRYKPMVAMTVEIPSRVANRVQ